TCGSPIEPGTAARPGIACCITGELATSACRVIAPTTTERPLSSTPARPSTSERSISADGLASRCFITGISEWPPASSLPSGLRDNSPAAWRTVVGRWNVKLYILLSPLFRRLACRRGLLHRRPDRVGGGRHGYLLAADRVGYRIDHRRRRRDRARLAAAFDAERIGGRFRFGQPDRERRQVVRVRHRVIHERTCDQLAVLVVNDAFEQRLADALRDAAMHLAFDDHRIDHGAEVVDSGPVHDLRLAGVAVDFHLTDVAAGGEGEIGRIVERGFFQPRLELRTGEFVRDVGVERDVAEADRLVGAGDGEFAVLELD